MKKMTISLTTALFLLLAGCAKESPSLVFQVSQTKLGYEGGSVTFNISSSHPWKLSCDDWWLETPVSSGKKGNAEFEATAHENKSSQARSVRVTVSAGGQARTVEIVQAAAHQEPDVPSGPDTPDDPNPNPPAPADEFSEYKRSGFKKMKILGYWGPGAEERDKTMTAEKYREMARCGFTLSLTKNFSVDVVRQMAAAVDGTGIQLIVGLSSLNEANVNAIKTLPQIYGYYCWDEPTVQEMPSVVEKIDVYKNADPSRMCYVNLLPMPARKMFMGVDTYSEYMDEYLKLGIPLLSYDFYSISGENMDLHAQYFEALDFMYRTGKEKNYPVWTFVLSYNHGAYYTTDEATMRFQAWAGLAYASDCIEYYTYLTPKDAKYGTGLLDLNYLVNDKWEAARELNARMQGLADVFVGMELLKVRGIGYSTTGLPALAEGELPAPFKSVRCGLPDGLLMSHFKNGDSEYLMLLNLSFKLSQAVAIDYEESAPLKEFVADGQYVSHFKTRQAASSRVLAPGDMALYQIK